MAGVRVPKTVDNWRISDCEASLLDPPALDPLALLVGSFVT